MRPAGCQVRLINQERVNETDMPSPLERIQVGRDESPLMRAKAKTWSQPGVKSARYRQTGNVTINVISLQYQQGQRQSNKQWPRVAVVNNAKQRGQLQNGPVVTQHFYR